MEDFRPNYTKQENDKQISLINKNYKDRKAIKKLKI